MHQIQIWPTLNGADDSKTPTHHPRRKVYNNNNDDDDDDNFLCFLFLYISVLFVFVPSKFNTQNNSFVITIRLQYWQYPYVLELCINHSLSFVWMYVCMMFQSCHNFPLPPQYQYH